MEQRASRSQPAEPTLAAIVALLVATLWKIVFLDGFVAPAVLSALVFLATAVGLAFTGGRWMPALAVAVAAFAALGARFAPTEQDILANPANVWPFVTGVIQLVGGTIAIVAGIGATMQNYREPMAAGER
jgi:asparagine N-glycosylation enzyme membrane subunit Stt3